ncbi:Uncharacterised protein [Klebsiella variicola]|uniref:Uncharacterized protein n=1 Tax=Klebsiella variicola TaxID=244366 RepID=A0A7H4MNN4_KLEVA|nr:Uncharacterised protein [Klebsiella variicola]
MNNVALKEKTITSLIWNAIRKIYGTGRAICNKDSNCPTNLSLTIMD